MTTFRDVYNSLIAPASDTPSLSPQSVFERLIFKLLHTAPAFRERFSDVTLWAGHLPADLDDPDFTGPTPDMLAERHDGGIVAVSCKLAITQASLEAFLRQTEGEGYAERLLFFTTSRGRVVAPVVDPPIELFDPEALDTLDPPVDWDSLLADEDLPPSPLVGVRPPRAAVAQARQHVQAAIDGIRDVTREMERQLDGQELREEQIAEHQVRLQLLRHLAIPTLEDLNARLDTLASSEARSWGQLLKRLATLVGNAVAATLLSRVAEALLTLAG